MPIINHISADSKTYIRGVKKKFIACLGLSLAFENVDSFKKRYYKFFEELKDKFNIDNPRVVFKSYDLKTIFPYEDYPKIARRFIDEVISDDVSVNVVFSSFSTQKIPKIRYLKEEIHIMDFLRGHLPQYYAYIPVWKTLQSTKWFGINVYLDNINPKEVTNAWEFIKENQCKIHIVPKGDQCNPLISSADIILEYLDYTMMKEKIRLDVKEIQRLLINFGILKSFVMHVGSKDIPDIIPKSSDKIPKQDDYIHPIVYVITERIINKERDWIEKSPVYQYLLWYAWKVNGGLKFISSDQDFKLVDKNDILVYLGETGKNKARYLSEVLNLVSPDNVIGLNDIIEKAEK
jgi:hypothetical protein